jgi:UDP-GlcNAc:undecaprenyl-phosphate/decaprenyl-phosphate GlcNAc-1-phosphate transferase
MSALGFAAICVAFVLSACAVAALTHLAARLPQDPPNQRSLHIRSVPRAGGYAIWAGFLPAALLYPPSFPGGVVGWVMPWLVLATISALDDVRGVAVGVRFCVHSLAALWTASWMWLYSPRVAATDAISASIAIVAMALGITWASNLYNFMDGNDGLCATMTFVGFGALGAAGLQGGDVAVPYFALAAATVPFLVVNRPRATMFLGDVGSIPLGFLAASFGTGGAMTGLWPAWFPALVFLPFIADATATLVRRIARGDRISAPHRDHYYQRLNRMGAGHAGTLSIYAALMAGTAATALGCLFAPPAWGEVALVVWCVVCFMLFAGIDYHWRKNNPTPP